MTVVSLLINPLNYILTKVNILYDWVLRLNNSITECYSCIMSMNDTVILLDVTTFCITVYYSCFVSLNVTSFGLYV